MSIKNPYSVSLGWKIDPDNRQDRGSGPITKYKLPPEEVEKRYGHIKGTGGAKPIVPGDLKEYWKRKEQNKKEQNEKGEDKMDKDMIMDKDMENKMPAIKMSKKEVMRLKEEGKTLDEITECFVFGWHGKPQLLKAKILFYMSDKKPERLRKKAKAGTQTDMVIADEFATSEIKGKYTTEEQVLKEFRLGSKVTIENADKFLAYLEDNFKKQRPAVPFQPVETEEYHDLSLPVITPVSADKVTLDVNESTIKTIKDAAKKTSQNIKHDVDEMMEMIPDKTEDIINNPKHYTAGGIETTDYIQAKLTPEQFEGFCIGTVIQYLSRYRLKGGIIDIKKAVWYLNRIIKVKEVKINE